MFKEPDRNSSALVLGGSGGVGRALVEQLAIAGVKVLAVSSDIRDLEALQQNCELKHSARIQIRSTDFSVIDFDTEAFASDCIKTLGQITHIFMPVGAISNEDMGVPYPGIVNKLAMINYIRPAQLISIFSRHFVENGFGNAMIFTSIATAAPRKNNIAYASAKISLEFYCLALQHQFANSNIKVQICALGYVDTTMSFGMKLLFPTVSPNAVAKFSIKLCQTNKRYAYYPSFWWIITRILKMLPWSVYKRLNF